MRLIVQCLVGINILVDAVYYALLCWECTSFSPYFDFIVVPFLGACGIWFVRYQVDYPLGIIRAPPDDSWKRLAGLALVTACRVALAWLAFYWESAIMFSLNIVTSMVTNIITFPVLEWPGPQNGKIYVKQLRVRIKRGD